MEIVRFGTMFEGGYVRSPGFFCQGAPDIFLGNTIPGHEMPWIKDGDRYIALHNACNHVSWHELNKRGYIYGVVVYIDGQQYICRSLKTGSRADDGSEWADLLKKYGTGNAFWHCEFDQFWGQEAAGTDNRVVRGYGSPAAWASKNAAYAYTAVGWRPVLEPLPAITELSDVSLGATVRLYGPHGYVDGKLSAWDDQHIELREFSSPCMPGWVHPHKEKIVVNQFAVLVCTELAPAPLCFQNAQKEAIPSGVALLFWLAERKCGELLWAACRTAWMCRPSLHPVATGNIPRLACCRARSVLHSTQRIPLPCPHISFC